MAASAAAQERIAVRSVLEQLDNEAVMAPEVARFTDKEGASLGSRFLEYKKAQAKSRKSGEPMPVPAPLVRRMLESMEKCQAG